jgi:hypothetical protein
LLASLVLLCACAGAAESGRDVVPIPRSSIAAAPLAAGRVAVLAGDNRAKAVSIIDTAAKKVLWSFGVTPDATGLSAASDDGPLLLSTATARGGTLERWTIDGTRDGVMPLPGPGLGVTKAVGDDAFVLDGRGNDRSAVGVDVWALKQTQIVPLASGVAALQQCRFTGGRSFLVYATREHRVVARDARSGKELRSTARADDPGCLDRGSAVYAVSRTVGAASLVVLAFPGLDQVNALPVSNTIVALYDAGGSRLMTLNSTADVGTLEILPRGFGSAHSTAQARNGTDDGRIALR